MTKIEVESLYDFLKEHENEIEFVILTWEWPGVAEVESDYCGTIYGEENYPLYHRFSYTRLDDEYSFTGTVEEALNFAESYDCWDGHEIDFENGIVIGYNEGYDPDKDEYPDDVDNLSDSNVYNVEYMGFYFYRRDHRGNSHHYYYSPSLYGGVEPYRRKPTLYEIAYQKDPKRTSELTEWYKNSELSYASYIVQLKIIVESSEASVQQTGSSEVYKETPKN